MKRVNVREMRDEDLVGMYLMAAQEDAKFFTDFDHKAANAAQRRLAAAYRELRRRGVAAQQRLLTLLDHPEPGVRAWVAAHAMEFAPEQGEPVLRALEEAGGLIGFGAGETLKVWKAGKLRFP